MKTINCKTFELKTNGTETTIIIDGKPVKGVIDLKMNVGVVGPSILLKEMGNNNHGDKNGNIKSM